MALDQVPQQPTLVELDQPPSLAEVQKAICQMISNSIPAEMYNAAGPGLKRLTPSTALSCTSVKKRGYMSRRIDSLPVHEQGQQGRLQELLGISLLSNAGKIFTRIFLNRLVTVF